MSGEKVADVGGGGGDCLPLALAALALVGTGYVVYATSKAAAKGVRAIVDHEIEQARIRAEKRVAKVAAFHKAAEELQNCAGAESAAFGDFLAAVNRAQTASPEASTAGRASVEALRARALLLAELPGGAAMLGKFLTTLEGEADALAADPMRRRDRAKQLENYSQALRARLAAVAGRAELAHSLDRLFVGKGYRRRKPFPPSSGMAALEAVYDLPDGGAPVRCRILKDGRIATRVCRPVARADAPLTADDLSKHRQQETAHAKAFGSVVEGLNEHGLKVEVPHSRPLPPEQIENVVREGVATVRRKTWGTQDSAEPHASKENYLP